MPRARAPAPEDCLDASCLPALLTMARPVLPAELVGRLTAWDELDEGERQRARSDLELMAALMKGS